MARLRPALLLCTALAAPLVGAGSASAQTTPLSGFGDFTSARVQLVLDDLGLAAGEPIPSQSGASFSVAGGNPARYYLDDRPRESGPDVEGGSIGNFVSATRPYPSIDVVFASPVHRVGFEARVNDVDELTVNLLLAGVVVGEVAVSSRGSDMLYFYGLQNPGGFDQVQVGTIAGQGGTGAFTLDNLTFESVAAPDPDPDPEPDPDPDPEPDPDPDPDPDPEPGPLALACDGFDSFPRAERGHHLLPVRALLAELHAADGAPVTDEDLASSPKLRVMFSPESGGPALDVTDRVVWRSPDFRFLGRRAQRWFVWVLPWHMRGYGTYLATLESGDPAEYTLDPTCADWTLNQRPQPPHRDRDCKDPRNGRYHKHLPDPRRGRH